MIVVINGRHNMINLVTKVIEEQERRVARFKAARSTMLEHIPGTGKKTSLTIDIVETEAVYELQGMMKILSRLKEGI